ncbi:MAG: NAD-dependent epimerase/dehydratase family protein [Candidatus Bathyarchaeia archaeon]
MRALVSGGSGFIGSHLSTALVDKGYEVQVFDRRPPKLTNVEWVDGDLRWIGDCDRATRDIDVVFHLAARISVDESIKHVREYFTENLLSTLNLVEAALKNGVKRFVYTSTCEVYGDTIGQMADEAFPCNPTSPYAASKYAAERAVLAFGRTYDIPVVVLRPFNTFGEGQKPFMAGAVIPTFIILALRNQDLVIHGDGSQTRDYTYVKDLAEAHTFVLTAPVERQSILNASSGVGHPIKDIAEQILRLTKSEAKLRFVDDPRKGAQLVKSVGNSAKLRALGWHPNWTFEAGLQRTIDWYKSELSRYPIPRTFQHARIQSLET